MTPDPELKAAKAYARSVSRALFRRKAPKKGVKVLRYEIDYFIQQSYFYLSKWRDFVVGLGSNGDQDDLGKLRSCKKVKSVNFDGRLLEVVTEKLYHVCYNDFTKSWRKYNFGNLRIMIDLGPRKFYYYNLVITKEKDRCKPISARNWYGEMGVLETLDSPHPHVNPSGSPCLGNAERILAELYAKGEIEAMVYVLIQFLESYQRGSEYISIENWPYRKVRRPRPASFVGELP